jgi:hypothetical protein
MRRALATLNPDTRPGVAIYRRPGGALASARPAPRAVLPYATVLPRGPRVRAQARRLT